jgi:hypothetical protein
MVAISLDTSGEIRVTFPYSPATVAIIKSVGDGRWHPDGKYWSFPHSEEIATRLLSAFAGEKLDVDQSLGVLVEPFAVSTLLDRVSHLIRLKHYSIRTEETYLHWITRYLAFHHNRDPKETGSPEIEAFLSYLAVNLKVASATQNVAFNALLFLYRQVLKKELDTSINAIRAKKPTRLPTVMSKNETMKVIAAIPAEHQLMVKLHIRKRVSGHGMPKVAGQRY